MAEPKFSKAQIDRLNADPVFQERIGNDKQLRDAFDLPDKTKDISDAEILMALGGNPCLLGFSVSKITPAIISILAMLESPFIFAEKEGKPADVDNALYVISRGRECLDKVGCSKDIADKAQGFCFLNNVEFSDAIRAIQKLIKLNLAGYEYFPDDGGMPVDKCLYDCEWLTRQVRIVSEVTNYSAQEIIWELSMLEVSYYTIQFARKNGEKNIRRRNRAGECMARLEELMTERIKEYGG